MGKRLLIGSMLVLAMLLLMPSIPALQQITIEEEVETREEAEEIFKGAIVELDRWYPGSIIILFLRELLNFIEDILAGNWFPGMALYYLYSFLFAVFCMIFLPT